MIRGGVKHNSMFWGHYLSDVLGIKSVTLPIKQVIEESLASNDLENAKILFLSERSVSRGDQVPKALLELPIFQKILVAMKLEFSDFFVLELDESELLLKEKDFANELFVICFSRNLFDVLKKIRPHMEVKLIDHPIELEKNPAKKKKAWNDFQEVLQQTGLSHRLSK